MRKATLLCLTPSIVTLALAAASASTLSALVLPARASAQGGADAPQGITPTGAAQRVSEEMRDVANYQSDSTVRDESRPTGTGFSIYAGLDLGVVQVVPQDTEVESSKFGYHIGVKALASLFTEDMVLDLGGGFHHSSVTGDRDIDSRPDGSREEVLDSTITTNAALVEFSPRLRLGDSFQIGPVGQALLGTDSSFALPREKETNAVLAGLSLFWGGGKDLLWRVGGQVLTDVNLYQRDVYVGLVSLHLGFPVIRQKTIVRDRRYLAVKENVRLHQVEKPVEKIVVKENVRFLFEEQIINFEFDKAVLLRKGEYFCSQLARYLTTYPDSYEAVTIEGHTDIRGSPEYNIRLSNDRAASVKACLAKNGVPAGRIRAQGFGYTRPIDPANNELAYARNRRVEMAFGGVRDPNRLREYIDKVKDQIRLMK